MYQHMRNKLYPWIVFHGDELLFLCERCHKIQTLNEALAKAQASEFAEVHKECKE